VFDSREFADLTCESVKSSGRGNLAYLAATGKIELAIRDLLGALITNKFPNLTAAREFKRRDLVILDDGVPRAVIEGKMWISFEANFPSKLHNQNPKEGLVAASKSDIFKMRSSKFLANCEKFTSTVLVGADIRQLEQRHRHAIKYANWYRRGLLNGADLVTAHDQGVSKFVDSMKSLGSVASARLFDESAFGMPFLADVVICQCSAGCDAEN